MTATSENLPTRTHTEYSVTRCNGHVTGLVQIPALGPAGTPCIFARIHAPYETEVLLCECKAEGGMPKIPSPFGVDSPLGLNANMVLLTWELSIPVSIPIGGATQGHITIVNIRAVYGRIQPEGVVRNYPTGKLPYETQAVDYNTLTPDNFIQGVVDPTTTYVPPLPLNTPFHDPIQGQWP